MRDGIHVPAGVVRLLALAVVALVALVLAREYPEIRRYINAERM